MSQELNEAATCFVAEWDDRPVAFCAVLPLPNGALKNAVRESRTVVLPDYQGIGIGSTLTDTIGGIYAASGYTLYSKIVNPALGLHRERSPLWSATGHNEKSRDLDSFVDSNGRRYFSRKSYCHKYIGPPVPGYENLIQPIEKMRKAKSLEGQLSLF